MKGSQARLHRQIRRFLSRIGVANLPGEILPHVRQAVVQEGWAVALERQRPTGRQYRKLDGAPEARLIALTCRAPPEGRARWTLQ